MTYDELCDQLLDYFEQNEGDFILSIEELDAYNGYLDEGRIYSMDTLYDFVCDQSVEDIMRDALAATDVYGGNFDVNKPYFYRNSYGRYISTDEIDYSYWLDKYFVQSLTRYFIRQKQRGNFHMYLPEPVEDMILNYLENAEDEVDF